MHTNVSISKDGKNLFWDPEGEEKLSAVRVGLHRPYSLAAERFCLLLNPSVNAYRRLDPHFEAPNQIKASAIDRGSMVRVPLGNEEARALKSAPSARRKPLHGLYSIFRPGSKARSAKIKNLRQADRYLPDNIYDALDDFAIRNGPLRCWART